MSPQFDVSLEIHKRHGVLDPVANTLNNVRGAILENVFGDKAGEIEVDFQKVGRTVSFIVECDNLDEATTQVDAMIDLPIISNPVIEDVTVTIAERIDPV